MKKEGLKKITEDLTLTGLSLLSEGLAWLSRYHFSNISNQLFGNDYWRSVAEHFLEGFAYPLFTFSLLEIIDALFSSVAFRIYSKKYPSIDITPEDYNLSEWKKRALKLFYLSLYLAGLTGYEIAQATTFNRPFQTEQYLGSLAGIAIGIIAYNYLGNLNFGKNSEVDK